MTGPRLIITQRGSIYNGPVIARGNSRITRGNRVILRNGEVISSDGDLRVEIGGLRCASSLLRETESSKTRATASYRWTDPTTQNPTEQVFCKEHWEGIKAHKESTGRKSLENLVSLIPETNSARRSRTDGQLVGDALKHLKPESGGPSA